MRLVAQNRKSESRGLVAHNQKFVSCLVAQNRKSVQRLVAQNRKSESRRLAESNVTTMMLVAVVGVFLVVEFPLAVIFIIVIVENTWSLTIIEPHRMATVNLFVNLFILLSTLHCSDVSSRHLSGILPMRRLLPSAAEDRKCNIG